MQRRRTRWNSARDSCLSNPTNLTSGRLLARNTIINLAGEVAPSLVALLAIPLVIRVLGVDRYGVLTLSIMVVGYFGLFDFGLGRAATKFIAAAAASSDQQEIPGLFWTSLFMMLAFGTAGGVVVAVLAPWLVHGALKIPVALQPESLHALYLLAFSMPFVISSGGLNGTLSAFQRFDLINEIRVPSAIFSYVGPLLVLPFSHSLGWLVAVVVLGRVAGWIVTFWLCLRLVPGLGREIHPGRATIRPMLSFGGWLTVSAVVSPIMAYFDRFLIGAMLSMAAVTYYAVPFQVATKLWIIPNAVSAVTFSAFSGAFSSDPDHTALLLESATKYIVLTLFAPVLFIITLAPEALRLWLGPSFADHSASALRWLTFAVFINSTAHPAYGLIQAADRPDLLAKLHLAEAPFYVAMLWWMMVRYGIAGVAITWTVRVVVTTLIVFLMAWRLLPMAAPGIARIATLTSAALLIFAVGTIPMDLPEQCLLLGIAPLLFAMLGWLVLGPRERASVRGVVRGVRLLLAQAH